MEHTEAAAVLNILAGVIAKTTSTPFNHIIVVSTETNGGRYRLTRGKKVIVHPDQIASGMMLQDIIADLIMLIASEDAITLKLLLKDIKVYKKSGEEAIEFLRKHLELEDFQSWMESV